LLVLHLPNILAPSDEKANIPTIRNKTKNVLLNSDIIEIANIYKNKNFWRYDWYNNIIQVLNILGSYVHLRWAANPSEVLNEVPRGSVGQEA